MSGNDGVLEKLKMIFPGHRRMRRLEERLNSLGAKLAEMAEAVERQMAASRDAAKEVVGDLADTIAQGNASLAEQIERVCVEGHAERDSALERQMAAALSAANETAKAAAEEVRAQIAGESLRVLSELFKNEIRCRWQILDALDGLLFPPDAEARCPICGHVEARSKYATKVSECIFGGGRLERYICPECGAIFGPLKMMALSCTQLAEEYKQSYSVYSESDCTMLEKMAFKALHPEKGKKYLNYGAGAWNRTTKDLRAEGYDVYDFEPYAPAESNPWVIRSVDELKKRKFDGIFSNDLIEHLRNPVEDLKSMEKLLKPGAGMAHCSGCYEYAFEYTRFHLFFLTGGSLERLCEETGLVGELSDRLFDYSPARLCVFKRKTRE